MWFNEWTDEYPVCHDHELKNNTLSAQAIITPLKKEKKKSTKNTSHSLIAVISNVKKIPTEIPVRKRLWSAPNNIRLVE